MIGRGAATTSRGGSTSRRATAARSSRWPCRRPGSKARWSWRSGFERGSRPSRFRESAVGHDQGDRQRGGGLDARHRGRRGCADRGGRRGPVRGEARGKEPGCGGPASPRPRAAPEARLAPGLERARRRESGRRGCRKACLLAVRFGAYLVLGRRWASSTTRFASTSSSSAATGRPTPSCNAWRTRRSDPRAVPASRTSPSRGRRRASAGNGAAARGTLGQEEPRLPHGRLRPRRSPPRTTIRATTEARLPIDEGRARWTEAR